MNQRSSGDDTTAMAGTVLGLGAAALVCMFYAAAWLTSVIHGGRAPRFEETVRALGHVPDVAAGFPAACRIDGLMYMLMGLFVLLLVVVIVAIARSGVFKDRGQAKAHMTRYEDVKGTLSEQAALAAAREGVASRMVVQAPNPKSAMKRAREYAASLSMESLITELGKMSDKRVYGGTEDSKLVVSPPRGGKTMYLAIGLVLGAPGPCVATSSKVDLLMLTMVARSRLGRVHVFDLDDISGVPQKVAWDPVSGCEDLEVALRRGQAWAGAAPMGENVRNGSFFENKAGAVLGRLLHAAAVSGGNMATVVRWANDLRSTEPVEALERNPETAAVGVAEYLRAQAESKARETTDSIQQTLANLLEPLASPRILRQLCPEKGQAFDIDEFLAGQNTLFLVSDVKEGVNTGPLVSMFTTEVLAAASRLSQDQIGQRLFPPVRAVLDEAANLAAFPEMDSFMADSGGRGIEAIGFFQSFDQIRARWGEHKAGAILGSANVKLFLPGLPLTKEVEQLAALFGQYEKRRISRTTQRTGGPSSSTSWDEKAVMRPEDIAQIPAGTAILQYRNLKPMHVTLTPWWKRQDAQQLRSDQIEAYRQTGKGADQILTVGGAA